MKSKLLAIIICLVTGIANAQAPLVLQSLDYTENPVEIPNPDRGFYRGRLRQSITHTIMGITPEVDHRVPVDANSVRFHGAQHPLVEGDNIELTIVDGTTLSCTPTIAFMGFDLCNFSSNAFLKAQYGLDFNVDKQFTNPDGSSRTGKTAPLTPYALDYIRTLFQKVRDGNGVAFVKFSYDGNGFNYIEPFKYPDQNLREGLIHGPEPAYVTPNNPSGMCDVPGHTDKDWIEYHLWQLKPILYEFEDIIMCVKTGMLGPWGEQHSSPMSLSPEANKKFLDACLDAVPASRSLLTNQRVFLSWYNLTYGTDYSNNNKDSMPVPPKGSPEARFGFFNDLYALNPIGGDRSKALTWINKRNQFFQGEGGIPDNAFGKMPGAIIEAYQLQTSNLNMRMGNYQFWNNFVYNEANVTAPVTFPGNDRRPVDPTDVSGPTKTAIFDPVYDGRTGLEFWRDRMGYRLVLREAKASEWVTQNGTLKFEGKIQNVGFGNVINKKKVSVVLKPKTGANSYTALTNLDARDWLNDDNGNGRFDNTAAWHSVNFSVTMSVFGNVPAGDYDIYLKINDPKEQSANKRCIRFANKGNSWNADLGANLIGSTTVM